MSTRSAVAPPTFVGVRRRLKLLLFVVVLFMSWALYTYIVQQGQMSDRGQQLRETEKQLSDAKLKSDKLTQEVSRLNDPEYIGQIARKDQGMGMPGEQAIHVEPTKP